MKRHENICNMLNSFDVEHTLDYVDDTFPISTEICMELTLMIITLSSRNYEHILTYFTQLIVHLCIPFSDSK